MSMIQSNRLEKYAINHTKLSRNSNETLAPLPTCTLFNLTLLHPQRFAKNFPHQNEVQEMPSKEKTNKRKKQRNKQGKMIKQLNQEEKRVELEWAVVSLLNTNTISRNLLLYTPTLRKVIHSIFKKMIKLMFLS